MAFQTLLVDGETEAQKNTLIHQNFFAFLDLPCSHVWNNWFETLECYLRSIFEMDRSLVMKGSSPLDLFFFKSNIAKVL